MGSPLRAIISGTSRRTAEEAWRRVRADVRSTEAILSRFRPESALTRLNTASGRGTWMVVPPRLYAFLATARRAWGETAGLFDPRVLARLEALGELAGVPLPALEEMGGGGIRPAAPTAHVAPGDQAPWLERRPRQREVRIAVPLDSGGIGKGLALRWAADLGSHLVGSGSGLLVEAGGDLVLRGLPPDGGAWRIGIEDPMGSAPLAVIDLPSGAVATSSIARRHWRDASGRQVHHLIDPRTREPGGEGLISVTVAAVDPAWAEVWSKVLFLHGSAGIGPAARSRGLAAWWLRSDGGFEMTPAARPLTGWERSRQGSAGRPTNA